MRKLFLAALAALLLAGCSFEVRDGRSGARGRIHN